MIKADDTPSPPEASPPPTPIKKVKVTTLRRVRDTAMTRRIKELYDYTCQFRGLRLTLPGGFGYAEGAQYVHWVLLMTATTQRATFFACAQITMSCSTAAPCGCPTTLK
jgi:hypothetical protein